MRRSLTFSIACAVALGACGDDGATPARDAGVDTSAPADADTATASDVTPPEDAADADVRAPTDTGRTDTGGPGPAACAGTAFVFAPGGAPSSVLLTGSFAGWAAEPPGATVMADADGDGTFEATLALEPGDYQYKYVVDGVWRHDPAAPTADDGLGGLNNTLSVAECGVELVSYTVDAATGAFAAVLTRPGGLAPADVVAVSVDGVPAPADAVTAVAGGVRVGWSGLSRGIHDIRVVLEGGDTRLLKVYVGVSSDWRDALIYFAMTDRFVNGDPANDAPVPGVDPRVNYQGGDFAGVTARLEDGYFDALGVGALWISWPIDGADGYHDGGYPDHHACGLDAATTAQTPARFSAYHGYWPSHTDRIEARFGTLAELQALVRAAHARGIRVLLDFTANHLDTSSPVYEQHRDDGWFNTPVELCEVVGWDTKPTTCWFTPFLADIDYRTPAARDFMLAHAEQVVLDTGADGMRLDAVKHIEPSFIAALRARMHRLAELTGVPFYLVGETFSGDVALVDRFVGPALLHGQFDFPANYQFLKGLGTQEIGLDAMDAAVRGIRAGYKDGGALMSTFIGNHDIARFASVAAGQMYCGVWDVTSDVAQAWHYPPGPIESEAPYQKLALALAYAYTIPGVPLLYYGDEIGMPGAGDPDNRRMMRFGDALSGREAALLATVQKLGRARAAHPALSRGAWSAPLFADSELIAYARTTPGELAVIVLNRSSGARAVTLDVSSLPGALGAAFTDALGGPGATASGGELALTVPARTAAILIARP